MFNNKDKVKDTFNSAAKKFDEKGTPFFRYFGQLLAESAEIISGMEILDIACGKGATTFPLAERLNGNGKIYAIDISDSMIEECKQRLNKEKINNIEFSVMDIEKLEFEDDSMDLVVCGFGLFFLPDIEKGLKEIKRVLKKDGMLVFSSWNGEYRLDWMYDLLAKYVPGFKNNSVKNTGNMNVNDFNSISGLNKILNKTGFEKISISVHDLSCYYKNEEEWLETRWNTAFRMHLEMMDEDSYNNFVDDAFGFLQDYKQNGTIEILMSAFITKAKK